MLGVQLVDGGAIHDLDRTLASLIHYYGFSLTEAFELLFPHFKRDEKLYPGLQVIYHYYRQAFGPYAQGPAAIISRYGDECVFSVDALGLSRSGLAIPRKNTFSLRKRACTIWISCGPIHARSRPGKMSVIVRRNQGVEVLDYRDAAENAHSVQAEVWLAEALETAEIRGSSQALHPHSSLSEGLASARLNRSRKSLPLPQTSSRGG
jgi:hypothetical protein